MGPAGQLLRWLYQILLQWIRSALLCGGIEEGVEELNRQAQKADHGEAPF